MTLPVHVHTVIPINHLDLPVNISTALHVHRYICSSVYLFSLFLHFRHNMHSYLSTHLLGYVHTDPHASPLPKLTCPLTDPSIYPPIMFILILSFRLTTKIYLYIHLLVQRYYYHSGHVCGQTRRFHRCINHLNYLWVGRGITVPTCLQ